MALAVGGARVAFAVATVVVAVVAYEAAVVGLVDALIVAEGEVAAADQHLAPVGTKDGMGRCCKMQSFSRVRPDGFWYARDGAMPWRVLSETRRRNPRELDPMTPGSGTEFVHLNHARLE